MKLETATDIAERIAGLLRPACKIVTIAGSIRRQKPEVKDIELVAVSRMVPVPSLFGTAGEEPAINAALRTMLADGVLALDKEHPRNGERYKRFVVSGIIKLDLFLADDRNFGYILALRTGDAAFSKALITPRLHGGLLPGYLKAADGYLWNGGEVVNCPTEVAFFQSLGLAWIDPAARNQDM